MHQDQRPLGIEWSEDFNTIRCYHEREVVEEIHNLVNDKHFKSILQEIVQSFRSTTVPTITPIIQALSKANSTESFQKTERSLMEGLLETALTAVEVSGLENKAEAKSCLFISNHRDIILDPLLINQALLKNGNATCHLAIGDNLISNTTGKRLAMLNKCFTVMRSVKSPRAMVSAMKIQSAYIRYLKHTRLESIWIAQREGRSKDNSDQTNPALLKMLALARPKAMPAGEYLKTLRIVPVSLSYEWDPCDKQKAQQLEGEKSGNYQKTGMDDLASVQDGLTGDKGRMHCSFDFEFNQTIEPDTPFDELANRIDHSIHKNYRLFPVNFAALHLNGNEQDIELSRTLPAYPSHEALVTATRHLKQRSDQIAPEEQQRIIDFYARPTMNFLNVLRQGQPT